MTNVVNQGILGHYVATASIVTGVYETFNNFAAVSPDNPTVFEYFRKDLKRPATDAWVVAPSNGFARIGESANKLYGPGLGAGVILPKRLLSAALSKSADGPRYQHLLRDNYETPLYAPSLAGRQIEVDQMAEVLKLSVDDFAAHARSLASPDELSVYIAKQLMRQLAPSLLWITLHDIDIAHSGTFSLYLDGIRRSDRLCAELWQSIQSNPEYANKTTMFILPDFGRDSDIESGGNGFQHHRTGDAVSRTTWMMALGPDVKQNVVVDRRVQSTDLIPTLGAYFVEEYAPRVGIKSVDCTRRSTTTFCFTSGPRAIVVRETGVARAVMLKAVAAGFDVGVAAEIRQDEHGRLIRVFGIRLNGLPEFGAQPVGAADAVKVRNMQ